MLKAATEAIERKTARKESSRHDAAMPMALSAMDEASKARNLIEKWPPEWGPIGMCRQYRNIAFYLDPNRRPKPTNPDMELFYKQVEETRGYEVTVDIDMNPFLFWSVTEPHFMFDAWCKATVDHINKQAERHGELYEFDRFVRNFDADHLTAHLLSFTVNQVKSGDQEIVGSSIKTKKTVQACLIAFGLNIEKVVEWRFKPE